MKSFKTIALFIVISVIFMYCKKQAGPGGKVNIKGKVFLKSYDDSYTILLSQYFTQGENVYITYGNETTVSDNVKTSYDGSYIFPYMRKGKYKIWAVSKDSSLKAKDPTATIAIIKEIEIKDRKGDFTVEDITILK
jgi:hypothetical protein